MQNGLLPRTGFRGMNELSRFFGYSMIPKSGLDTNKYITSYNISVFNILWNFDQQYFGEILIKPFKTLLILR